MNKGQSAKPGISIIMPVYNGENFIVKSLPPLIEMQKRGEVLEVIVVDDSSTDSTSQIAERLGTDTPIVNTPYEDVGKTTCSRARFVPPAAS